MQHAASTWVVREQARDLRHREHEDQVEEQLERRYLVLGVGRAVGVGHARIMPTRRSCIAAPNPL